MSETVEKVQKIFHFDDMEVWLQDNQYIRTGYRICASYTESWMSMTYWHNETLNIWTHLVSGVIFVGMIFNIWINWQEPMMDKVVFTIYCICAIKCFFMSSLFHLHSHQPYKTFRLFSCLDYAGISIMIMGSCILLTYYVYYCDDTFRTLWIFLTVLVSFVGILGPFFEPFAKHPSLRAICYIASAGISGLPVGYHMITHSIPFNANGIFFFLGMVLCYIGGAGIYVYQVPERFSPGSFDYILASHQIWHLCVFAAAVLFYLCALDMLAWRDMNQCQLIN